MRDERKSKDQLICELRELRTNARKLEVLRDEVSRSRQELTEAENKYQRLAEESIDGIAVVQGVHIKFVNKALLKMFGLQTKEQMLDRDFTDFISPEYREVMIKRGFARERRIHDISCYEFKALRQDGTEFEAKISVSTITFHGNTARQGIVRDISNRKQTEKALKESEARYKGIIDCTNNGVAVYKTVDEGNHFIIMDFNKAAEKIEKLKKSQVVGRSILEVFPGIKEFGLFEVLRRVWLTGEAEHHPVSFYKDDRISGWRENFVYKLPSGEIVAVYSDETERKRVEETLRKANEYLSNFSKELEKKVQERTKELKIKSKKLIEAEKLAVLGKMANRVAHDLRNSLMVVGGFARRLNEKMPDDDPNKKYPRMIVKEVMSLEQKVSRIIKTKDEF